MHAHVRPFRTTRTCNQMHERQPTREAIAAIRDHLASAHGRTDFDLVRDVSFVESNADSAVIVSLPESGISAARFTCKDPGCAGLIFAAGEPSYGHPERSAFVLFAHPELSATLLHGITDPQERAIVIEDWDRGRLGRLNVKAAHTRRAQSTKKEDRPTVTERRTRCQAFLLTRVRTGARVADAIADLDELRTTDPPTYRQLMRGPEIRTPETFKKYWSGIPIAVRNAARAQGALVRAAGTDPPVARPVGRA